MSILDNFKKAIDVGLQGYIHKARKAMSNDNEYLIERKSISGMDKHEENEAGYKERASSVTFDILRQMAMRNTIISAIIMTRTNQVKSFGRIQPTKYDVGYKFQMRDKDETPTDEDKKKMKDLEKWILTTGSTENRPANTMVGFVNFLGMMTRDLLIYDQVAIETVEAKDDTLAYFIPAASGSMRLASKKLSNQKDVIVTASINGARSGQFFDEEDQKREEEIIKKDAETKEPYQFVQVYEGQIVRGFFPSEMIVEMMNQVTDLEANGYSVGPLELLANIVSYHLFAEAHNRLFFVQGFASRGILHIEGDIPTQQLDAFRRQWREQLSGTQNSWRTPILAGGDKINWISLQATNRDMEWSAWMEYLIKLMCALYSIAPQEINFDITKAQGPSLSDSGSKNDSLLTDSRVRGLWPILKFFESILNDKILKRYDEQAYEKYEFVFCGLDTESKEKELERIEKEVSNYKTINEVRAEHDLEGIEGGDIVKDGTYVQWLTNLTTSQQEQSQDENGQEQIPSEFTGDNPDQNDSQDQSNEDNSSIDQITKSWVKSIKFTKPKLLKVEYWKK